ncbi:MAG: alpha-ketoglutarate-dependent dioxygenase AlkB [Saprospiraceae bacterium]
MSLFVNYADSTANLLPKDGVVRYFGCQWDSTKATAYYHDLLQNIAWKNDEAMMFGKHIITKRKVAWYGDQPFEYEYSHIKKRALPWSDTLKSHKLHAEMVTGETYNSCLLNLYHSGEEGMAWHSDGEKDLKKDGAIASLSFGAERKFAFKHKESKETISVLLEHGSLLLMGGKCQTYWLHRLPPSKLIKSPRINLTFRTIED